MCSVCFLQTFFTWSCTVRWQFGCGNWHLDRMSKRNDVSMIHHCFFCVLPRQTISWGSIWISQNLRARKKRYKRWAKQRVWIGSSGCVIPEKVRIASIRFGWSSYQGRMGDVLALGGFEGRGRLRKAWGNRQTGDDPGIPELAVTEYIGCSGQRGELKHLSIRRNRKKNRFPE